MRLQIYTFFLSTVALITSVSAEPSANYTVINARQYREVVAQSRVKIQKILHGLQPLRQQSRDEQVAFIAQQLANTQYLFFGSTGEGDWQPTSSVYKPGAVHIDQHPVYRLDGLDCQTYVQVVMSLLYSNNIDQFDRNYLKIAYGAAGNPGGEIVHYFNRNHFVDGDFNPINQRNGFLFDVTTDGNLSSYAEKTTAIITRQNWFLNQQKFMRENVNVLSEKDGPVMAKRFKTVYSSLHFPNFQSQSVGLSYIPKEKIAKSRWDGTYQPDLDLLDSIPSPAIAEIVSDVKMWSLSGINIKDLIGSELNISHFGLLHRQTFKHNEVIYRDITCSMNINGERSCNVEPVICKQDKCNELMFTHATDAYPKGYYWYQKSDGNFTCSPNPPARGTHRTMCNRVEQIPLFDYLTDFQYGSYINMNNPSVLGIHVEKLL